MQKSDNTPAQPAPELGRLAYSINDFAKAADISRSKIYEEIRAGNLKAKKIGAATRILAPDASDYLSGLPDLDTKAA